MAKSKAAADPIGRLRVMVSAVMDLAETDPQAAKRVYREWVAHLPTDASALADHPETPSLLSQLAAQPGGFRSLAGDVRSSCANARRGALRIVTPEDAETIAVPGAARCPAGYYIDERGVWRAAEDPVQVTREPLAVTGIARDDASGQAHVTLTWRHAGRWLTRTVPRGQALDSRRLLALADEGLPVDSTTAGLVVGYLAACEAAADVPIEAATSVLGWQAGGGFQWGEATLGGEQVRLVLDGGEAQIADALHASGNMDGWGNVWSEVVHHPRIVIGIYAAIAPVLLGIIPDAPSFVVDFSGRSSTGKTTAIEVIASVWGRPAALIANWSGSMTAIERRAALLSHLPTILDDTKQARSPEVVAKVLYDVCGSRGRDRGKPVGMQRTAQLRTVLISTGERPAVSHSQDAGSRARTLSIRGMIMHGGDRPENRRLAEWLHLTTSEHYGHLGPAVARWLAENRERWPAIAARWREVRAGYNPDKPQSGFLGRAAGYLALLQVAGEVVERAAGLAYSRTALGEAVAAAQEGAEDADRPKAAMVDLLSYLAGRSADVYRASPGEKSYVPDRAIGRWDAGDAPAVIRAVAAKALKESGYELDDVLGVWGDRGWLHVKGSEYRRDMRIGEGHPARLLGLTKKALEDVGWGVSGED